MRLDLHLTDKTTSLPFLIIGFLTGVTLAVFEHYNVSYVLSYVWVGLYGLMFLLAYEHAKSLRRLLITTAIISFFAGMPFVWPNTESLDLFFLLFFSAYAINSFHIVYQKHGFEMSYEPLFFAVWDTCVKLLIGALFTGLCWLILEIWSGLFNLIGIHFFDNLFQKPWFIIWSIPFFSGIGLFIATQTKKVVRSVRLILLAICKFLLPVLAGIGILFVLSWLVSVILFHHTLNFKPILFLSFAFLTIIFTNAVYQEGLIEKPYPRFFLWVVNTFLLIAPVFSLLTLYALFFNRLEKSLPFTPLYLQNSILQVGLNSVNFPILINATLLLIYSICYAFIVLCRQKPWLKSIGKANVILALIVISVVLITNNYAFKNAPFNPGKIRAPAYHQNTAQQIKKSHKQYNLLKKRLADAKFAWNKNVKNALVLGYNRNSALKLCRQKTKRHYYSGIIKKGTCQSIKDKDIISTSNFTVLTGPAKRLSWKVWLNYYNYTPNTKDFPVVVGFDGQHSNFVCRTVFNNRIYVGIYSYNDSRCYFVADNKIQKYNPLEYLYVK